MSSPSSDPYPYRSSFQSTDLPEASPTSDGSTRRATHSDEEIILASSRPKKCAGRKKFKETRHPVYRGVRRRNNNKWVCELREPNKKSRIWLGTYPNAEMAARAHDVAALALKGQLACLNFADSVWRLPVPVSKDAKDIRSAAAEAAEAFRPREYSNKLSEGASSSVAAAKKLPENVYYMEEEEAIFDMQGLLVNMAEGPLLSPPPCLSRGFIWDDAESDFEVSLWTY